MPLTNRAGQGWAEQNNSNKTIDQQVKQNRGQQLHCFPRHILTDMPAHTETETETQTDTFGHIHSATQSWQNRCQPVVLGSSGEDVSIMDLAGDRVAGCDPLAHLQLAG